MKCWAIAGLMTFILRPGPAMAGIAYCENTQKSPCFPRSKFEDLKARLDILTTEIEDYNQRREAEESLRREAIANPRSLDKLDKWSAANAGLSGDEANLKDKLSTILQEVSSDYRVPVDFDSERPIRNGAYDGAEVRFRPKIILDDIYVERKKAPDGRVLTFVRDFRGDRAAATTLPNGTVVFRMGAFLYGPGALAAYVHHEGVHHGQWTTPGGVTTREQDEIAAYGETLKFADDRYELPPDVKAHFEAMRDENKEKVAADRRAKAWWRLHQVVGQPTPRPELLKPTVPSDDDWKAMERYAPTLEARLDGVTRQRDKLLKRLHYEKDVRGGYERRLAAERGQPIPDDSLSPVGGGMNERRYPAPPPPVVQALPVPRVLPVVPLQPARPSVGADPYATPSQSLAELAAQACSMPGAITQTDIDKQWARVYGSPVDAAEAERIGLTGCAAALFRELAPWTRKEGLGRISVDWVRGRAQAYQPVPMVNHLEPERPPRRPSPSPADPCSEHGSFGGVGTGCVH